MSKKKYHMIGIGGIGMSALAHMLLQKKVVVTGSDKTAGAQTASLEAAGGKVFIGHHPDNVSGDSTVVYSTDIKKDNVEYQAAQRLGCPLLHRSELLQQLMSDCRYELCVAGTHGKTNRDEKKGRPGSGVGRRRFPDCSRARHAACGRIGDWRRPSDNAAVGTNLDS